MAQEVPNQERFLGIIARTLAYLCVHATDLRDAELGPKAVLLESFGLSRADVAVMLDTTEGSVQVSVSNERKKRKKSGGRKNK